MEERLSQNNFNCQNFTFKMTVSLNFKAKIWYEQLQYSKETKSFK